MTGERQGARACARARARERARGSLARPSRSALRCSPLGRPGGLRPALPAPAGQCDDDPVELEPRQRRGRGRGAQARSARPACRRRPGRGRARAATAAPRARARRRLAGAGPAGAGGATAGRRSSSRTSCAVSTSFAPSRISWWQPFENGEWIEPGIANTSRPCSPARRAVMSEPDDSVASTTSTPRARPLMRRLRRGKFCFSGGVPGANSDSMSPRAGRSRARGRDCAPDRRGRARCRHRDACCPAPASAPRCAAASMPSGEPADDREARRGQRGANASASAHALRRRVAAADDRERRPAEEFAPAEAVEHRRRVADLEQRRADSRGRPRRRGRARLREPGERGREALGRRAGVERRGDCGRGNARAAAAGVAASTASGPPKRAQQLDQRPRRQAPIACSAAQASTRASTIIARAAGRSASRRFAVDRAGRRQGLRA